MPQLRYGPYRGWQRSESDFESYDDPQNTTVNEHVSDQEDIGSQKRSHHGSNPGAGCEAGGLVQPLVIVNGQT